MDRRKRESKGEGTGKGDRGGEEEMGEGEDVGNRGDCKAVKWSGSVGDV